jgi:hypothetical protein
MGLNMPAKTVVFTSVRSAAIARPCVAPAATGPSAAPRHGCSRAAMAHAFCHCTFSQDRVGAVSVEWVYVLCFCVKVRKFDGDQFRWVSSGEYIQARAICATVR